MPDPIETTEPEGVDFAWVMQTTFVLTIVFGAPIVALASIPASLPTWGARVNFAIRVGAVVWVVVAVGAYLYARRVSHGDRDERDERDERDGPGTDGESGRGRTDVENRTHRDRRDARHDRKDTEDEIEGENGSMPPASGQSASSERTSET